MRLRKISSSIIHNVAIKRQLCSQINKFETPNPKSGARLSGKLDGWLVRHGGAGHRLTIVFKPDLDAAHIYLALVAFGGRDWMRIASARQVFAD